MKKQKNNLNETLQNADNKVVVDDEPKFTQSVLFYTSKILKGRTFDRKIDTNCSLSIDNK